MDTTKVWKNRARNHYKRLYGHGQGASNLGRILNQLFNSRTWVCPYTGQTLSLSNVSIDHIVPISKGGTNQLSNLQFISRKANQAKDNLHWQEFNATVKPVPLSTFM